MANTVMCNAGETGLAELPEESAPRAAPAVAAPAHARGARRTSRRVCHLPNGAARPSVACRRGGRRGYFGRRTAGRTTATAAARVRAGGLRAHFLRPRVPRSLLAEVALPAGHVSALPPVALPIRGSAFSAAQSGRTMTSH